MMPVVGYEYGLRFDYCFNVGHPNPILSGCLDFLVFKSQGIQTLRGFTAFSRYLNTLHRLRCLLISSL